MNWFLIALAKKCYEEEVNMIYIDTEIDSKQLMNRLEELINE